MLCRYSRSFDIGRALEDTKNCQIRVFGNDNYRTFWGVGPKFALLFRVSVSLLPGKASVDGRNEPGSRGAQSHRPISYRE